MSGLTLGKLKIAGVRTLRGGVFQARTPTDFRPQRGETVNPTLSRVEIVFENRGHIFMVGRVWRFDASTGPIGESAESIMERNEVFIFKSFKLSMRELENDTKPEGWNRA